RVLGQVEPVHGARKIDVRARIEMAHHDEPLCMTLEVRLELELVTERLARRRADARAAEALRPLGRGPVRDDAELPREAHAFPGHRRLVVVAVLEVRIAQDGLALERPD